MMSDGNDDDDDEGGGGENESRGHFPIINPPWSFQFAVAFAIRQNSGIMSINPSVCAPYVVSHTNSAPFCPAPHSYVLSEMITPWLSIRPRMRKAVA